MVFERSVSLYKHKGGIAKLASYETVSNPVGLCCLGAKIMVLPGRSAGQLQIVGIATERKMDVQIVPVHSSSLRAIELSPNEEVVASASDKVCFARQFHLLAGEGKYHDADHERAHSSASTPHKTAPASPNSAAESHQR